MFYLHAKHNAIYEVKYIFLPSVPEIMLQSMPVVTSHPVVCEMKSPKTNKESCFPRILSMCDHRQSTTSMKR